MPRGGVCLVGTLFFCFLGGEGAMNACTQVDVGWIVVIVGQEVCQASGPPLVRGGWAAHAAANCGVCSASTHSTVHIDLAALSAYVLAWQGACFQACYKGVHRHLWLWGFPERVAQNSCRWGVLSRGRCAPLHDWLVFLWHVLGVCVSMPATLLCQSASPCCVKQQQRGL